MDRSISNQLFCHYGDTRQRIIEIPDNAIDLVITSPPYLNSRDYTDIYMAELWVLDLITSYEELRALRNRTLRSHVQVNLGDVDLLQIPKLTQVIEELAGVEMWNSQIPSMIKAYFLDMDILFSQLKSKMGSGKMVFFNVANSAYYGTYIEVDEIVSHIAQVNGFEVQEIREARKLRPSSQQKDIVGSLRESVIVMRS